MMSRFAVIDTEITWGDAVMSIGLSLLIRRPSNWWTNGIAYSHHTKITAVCIHKLYAR